MKYIILVALFLASCVFGDQYVMTKSVFSSAGGASSSSSYILKDAVGQSVTGQSSSSSRIEQAGFFNYTKKPIGVQEVDQLIPKIFSLSTPYPNPVANSVIIRYGVPRASQVSIVVYNVAGCVVKTLVNGEHKPGFHTLRWDRIADTGGKITQGVYFIRMVAPEFKSTKKLIVIK